jgi:RNA polymerase sigma-70 factor (ECF subfamily)
MSSNDSTTPLGGLAAPGGYAFQSTHWSVVLAAGEPGHPAAQKALAVFCQNYWYPLYAFVRRKGRPPEEAKDLTQDFFAVVLEKNYLSAADRERGRFRTFLLAAAENFLRNDWSRRQILKRGGGMSFVSFEADTAETRYLREPADGETPEKLFDRRWAVSLLETVMEQLRAEFAKAGKESQFEVLEVFLSGEKHPASHGETAARLNMSEGAIRVAVHRLRQRYGELLRKEIAATLANPRDVDDELRHLLAVLSG